jgi:alkaline ceramidase TOD1/glycosyltransferase MUCI70-like protein
MIVRAYSAIYGDYDHPKPVHQAGFSRPPLMFTDNEVTADEAEAAGWETVVVRHHFESPHGDPAIVVPMLNHKYWKCHPDWLDFYIDDEWPARTPNSVDASIWLDGSVEPKPGFEEKALAALGDDDWACVPHPVRNCIYPEAEYSATLTWRYDGPSILAQADHYRQFHPPGTGLIATGVNIRRHTPAVIELSHLWWDEILNWSHQDQISLPVLLRLAEGKVKWNMNLTWHQDWILHPHG